MKKLTTQEFIDRARAVHGDKYGYAFSVYQSAHTKVSIHCPEHGMFEQSPNQHTLGQGCPLCGFESSSSASRMTNDEFINKAQKIHGDKYNYSSVVYSNALSKIKITCNEHGFFEQVANSHLSGHGCPDCAGKKKHTNESFIEKAISVHGNKYDYSKVNYLNSQSKVKLICAEHGEFEQIASDHINLGCGCLDCSGKKKHTNESFIEKASEVHDSHYGYSKVEYVSAREKVIITCPDHGYFEQAPASHLSGQGCPSCSCMGQSKPETEIVDLIKSLGLQVVHGDRSVIKPLEIDILVPEAKLAIEFNGNYWHSDQQKPKSYHFDKTKAANEAGYRMIHVWEGDWDARKDQIKRIIINACGKTNEKPLNARDCKVEEIEMKVVNEFLDEHHIQGRVHQGKIKLGLVHKTEGLVAVMTFGKGTNIRGNARLNAEAASDVPWNLTRYAAKHSVRGGASKLFKVAVTRYELTFVESYSMNDYFTGGMYEQLGFDRTTAYGADYRVFHPKTGIRFKYHWQRRNIPNVLRDIGREDIVFNPDKSIDPRTEYEIEDLAGALRLWDSGKTKWTWRATLPEHI